MPSRADTAKLIASLELQDKTAKGASSISRSLTGIDKRIDRTSSKATQLGQHLGIGIRNGAKIAAVGIAALSTALLIGLNQLGSLEDRQAQTAAVIKSTGAIARVSATDVRLLAEEYENLNATIDDKVIQSGENLLLTFTNVRKEAFEPALAAALDMNQALGRGPEGLNTTITQLGKALNDPAKGITALRKAGVLFTADQIKQIKALQESGDLLGAQRIILKELGTEFGGSFAAAGKTATGTIAGIGDAAEDLQKTLATGLFPVVQKVLPRIREALANPAVLRGAEQLGDAIAGLFSDQNIEEGSRALSSAFKIAQDVAPAIAQAATITGQAVKTAVDLFRSLPPEIQALAVAGLAINKLTGGLVTNLAGGLISAVISSFKGLMNVNAAVVNVNGAVGGVPGVPGVKGGPGIGSVIIPVAIASIAVGAAGVLGDAIDPAGKEARENGTALGQRDPRRFANGTQRAANTLAELVEVEKRTGQTLLTDAERTKLAQAQAARNQDRTLDSIEKLRGAITSETLTVAVSGPVKISRDEIRGIFAASGAARGVTNRKGASTSLQPRLDFLAGDAGGSKDVAVARSLATLFTQSNAPLYTNTANLVTTIKALKADAKTLGPKSAAKVGGYIKTLQSELTRRQSATTQAIKDKDQTVTVNANTTTFLTVDGRTLTSTVNRFRSVVKNGAPEGAFGG